MKVFDNYEISPCTRFEESDRPGHFYYEVCKPEDADVWTLYGHIPGEGARAIGDFDTREHAEEAFQRITGIPFGSHKEIARHLRVMHAGPKLLADLEFTREWFTENCLDETYHGICDHLDETIAGATGRAS